MAAEILFQDCLAKEILKKIEAYSLTLELVGSGTP
jgi:hypothetical protein